jgi:hypothetical protein
MGRNVLSGMSQNVPARVVISSANERIGNIIIAFFSNDGPLSWYWQLLLFGKREFEALVLAGSAQLPPSLS